MSIRGKDAEAFIDAARRAGLPITEQGVNVAALTGDTDTDTKGKPLPSCRVKPGVYLVGVKTYSITNSRDTRAAIGRKGHQKAAVFAVLGRWHADLIAFADEGIHAGKPLTVKLVRLAPRIMDDDNVQASLKYLRDAVADVLGSRDNNPLIHWQYGQEKSQRVGVRIELQPAGA